MRFRHISPFYSFWPVESAVGDVNSDGDSDTISATSNKAQARPSKTCRLSKAAHSVIGPVARKCLEEILRCRGARNPVATSPSFCAVAKKSHEAARFSVSKISIYRIFCWVEVGKNPENPRFSWLLVLCLLCLRPPPPFFGCIWLPLAFSGLLQRNFRRLKRNCVIYLDGRRKKQPRLHITTRPRAYERHKNPDKCLEYRI